jgi:hypothetical protein
MSERFLLHLPQTGARLRFHQTAVKRLKALALEPETLCFLTALTGFV